MYLVVAWDSLYPDRGLENIRGVFKHQWQADLVASHLKFDHVEVIEESQILMNSSDWKDYVDSSLVQILEKQLADHSPW